MTVRRIAAIQAKVGCVHKLLFAAALGCACLLAACGGDEWSDAPAVPGEPRADTAATAEQTFVKDKPLRIRAARCPAGAANCSWAVGRVIYIESVDPDGDGDLHVVAIKTKGEAVTGGGLVVFDVAKDVRPRRDPNAGDLVTGAGPVFPAHTVRSRSRSPSSASSGASVAAGRADRWLRAPASSCEPLSVPWHG